MALVETGLETLAGLSGVGQLDALSIYGAPALRGLGALSGVTRLGSLSLVLTGVENFDGLQLESLDGLYLEVNASLTNADALARLSTLGYLTVIESDALEHLPVFPNTQLLTGVNISGNDALVDGPAFPLLTALGPSGGLSFIGNANLGGVTGFPALETAGYIQIRDNARLGVMDFPNLAQVDLVDVSCNPALDAETIEVLRPAAINWLGEETCVVP